MPRLAQTRARRGGGCRGTVAASRRKGARDRRVRSVAPRVVRAVEETEVAHGRGFIEIGAGVVQTTEPDDGGQSPRHEAWCAAPVDALTALSHTPESPHPKRCPPVLPASRCCFAPSRSVPSYTRSVHSTAPVRGFAELAERSARGRFRLRNRSVNSGPRSYSAPHRPIFLSTPIVGPAFSPK